MLTIFVKTGCPYCAKALAALDAHNVSFEEKNFADEAILQELLEKGGKKQVPFIIDGDVSMYESDAIVSYIETTYGKGESKPRVHIAQGTGMCPS